MSINKHVLTPTFLQMEAVECGAACLQIILAYHGNYQSLETLREMCNVTRDGVSAENILNAAENFGLSGEGLMAELPDEVSIEKNLATLCEKEFPYILFWENKHFVVLEGIKEQQLYINDPAFGRYSVSYDFFSKAFSGIILHLEKTQQFKTSGHLDTLWSLLLQRVKPYKTALIHVLLISFLLVVPGILFPALSRIFIDDIILDNQQNWLRPFLWAFFGISLLECFLIYSQKRLLLYLQTRIAIDQGLGFFKHLLHLPILYFEQRYAGDLVHRIESTDRVAEILSGETGTAIVNLVSLGLFAIVMLILSPSLALITITIAVLQFFIIKQAGRKISDGSKLYLSQLSKLMGIAITHLRCIETIKLQGLENDVFNRIDIERNKTLSIWHHLRQKLQWMSTLPQVLMLFNSIIVLLLGVMLIMKGYLTIGTLVAFFSLIASFQLPLKQLATAITQLKTIEGDIQRLDDVLNYSSIVQTRQNKQCPMTEFSLKNIKFGYNKLNPPLLNEISLSIKLGESIGLVGESGSGKSTLLRCLTGLYTPWSGEIVVNEVLINEIDNQLRSQLIGVVSQNCKLFQGTIRENLNFWNPYLTDNEMINALKKVELYQELLERGGLDAIIHPFGINLSGGQIQRMELAQALVKKPHFLILDEATSALDPITERRVLANIKQLNCALLMVTQHLSTIKECQRIIVLHEGRIVEEGTHESLMTQQGFYYGLYSKQTVDIGEDFVSISS